MASRIAALLIWAAVAASLAYWGLRWLAPPVGVPTHAAPVTLETGVRGDIQRLLTGPTRSAAPQANPSAASALGSRIKVIGVMAPAPGQTAGVALLSIDGKPPKAYRVGAIVDGEMVLQGLSQRSAQIGPQDGSAFLNVDLPGLPPPATGSLPPPTGVTQAPQAVPQPGMPPEGAGQQRSPD
jgi:general secretion pathway protein C